MLALLYAPPPQGFEQAIGIGEVLVTSEKCKDSASVHVWLARAYAQKYGYEKKQGGNDGDLAGLKKQVLAEIKIALQLDPTARASLIALWHPADTSPDNDLSVFAYDDSELKAILQAQQTSVGPLTPAP